MGFYNWMLTFQVSDVENFITENLAVHGKYGEEGEKSFLSILG